MRGHIIMNSIPKDQHSRCSTLKEMLVSPGLAFLMEAHDGLSAKIVEKSGHAGIWASGLSISTALGLRDCNEAAWTQMQASVEMMADAVTIPILVDGDSGYGNFNNARRVATKFEQAGASGICIEDKLFPKMNSFRGERQALAEKYEFCGRIRAIKDSQRDKDFVLVARTEALISGYSMQEALDRCSYYSAAGADAILIHSKKTTPHEILEFLSAWKNHSPVVIVPTTYCQTSSILLNGLARLWQYGQITRCAPLLKQCSRLACK